MLDTLERPQTNRKLKPEEFRSQLWIGVTSEHGDLLPRYEIEWKQPVIDMLVPSNEATYTDFQVYDRAVGGELLLFGHITPAVRALGASDITTTIRLSCEFWP